MTEKNVTQLMTELIHHPYAPPAGFAAPQPGVHKASTVFFENTAAMRAADRRKKHVYSYGLHGTPTSYLLEERLAFLEGAKHCVLAPSGLAAITTTSLALLEQGDHVLVPDNVYDPNKSFACETLARWGISHGVYDPMNPADLAARITERTKLVWLEVPGSVTMEFPDLPALVQVCRERGVVSALDNTWGAGVAFRPFDFGIDVSVHALTKYPSGGGDVLMGSITSCDDAIHARIKAMRASLGLGVGANDVELLLRSLPSLDIRYRAQDSSARKLAFWLSRQPEVEAVLHPALRGAPGHEHWQALCGEADAAAGLFSIVFKPEFSVAKVDAFCDAMRLFKIGYSWGGPISLVVPYDIAHMRDAQVSAWPFKGIVVRFSIGFEATADLQVDLQQALAVLRGPATK